MAMQVFVITTTIPFRNSRTGDTHDFSFFIEFDGDLDALCKKLHEGPIVVNRLIATDDGRGGKLVKAREEKMIFTALCKMIAPSVINFWESA